jgi:hypothetical protein
MRKYLWLFGSYTSYALGSVPIMVVLILAKYEFSGKHDSDFIPVSLVMAVCFAALLVFGRYCYDKFKSIA